MRATVQALNSFHSPVDDGGAKGKHGNCRANGGSNRIANSAPIKMDTLAFKLLCLRGSYGTSLPLPNVAEDKFLRAYTYCRPVRGFVLS